jgi:hypothetical protein
LIPGPLKVIETAVRVPIAVARFALSLVTGGGSDEASAEEAATQRYAAAPDTAFPRRQTREAGFQPKAPEDLPPELVEDHIEVPVEKVAESADPGAEDPPGPELHIDEALKDR